MSVRVADRKEGRLQVLDLAMQLAVHTVRMCKSERFPKRDRWILAKPIAEDAIKVYSCIKGANSTLLKDGPTLDQDFAFRHGLQLQARAALTSFLGNLHVAYKVCRQDGIKFDGMDHWVRLAMKTNDKLLRWMASDTERYLDLKGGLR